MDSYLVSKKNGTRTVFKFTEVFKPEKPCPTELKKSEIKSEKIVKDVLVIDISISQVNIVDKIELDLSENKTK